MTFLSKRAENFDHMCNSVDSIGKIYVLMLRLLKVYVLVEKLREKIASKRSYRLWLENAQNHSI